MDPARRAGSWAAIWTIGWLLLLSLLLPESESVARRDLNVFFLFYVFTEVTVRTRGTWRHLMPLVTQSGKGSELQCKSQIPKEITASSKPASQKRSQIQSQGDYPLN